MKRRAPETTSPRPAPTEAAKSLARRRRLAQARLDAYAAYDGPPDHARETAFILRGAADLLDDVAPAVVGYCRATLSIFAVVSMPQFGIKRADEIERALRDTWMLLGEPTADVARQLREVAKNIEAGEVVAALPTVN